MSGSRALLEQGIGVFEIVAIAVVEGEADEAPLVLPAQASIERYDVEACLLHLVEHVAMLPHQTAPNSGYAVRLGDFTAIYEGQFGKRSRATLERKERKLADTGPIVYGWADSRNERLALLDIFFAQKSRHFTAMGVKISSTPMRADRGRQSEPLRSAISRLEHRARNVQWGALP